MSNRHHISIGGTAVLLVLALFGAVAYASVSRLSKQQQAVVETNAGISSVQQLLVASYEAEQAGAAFLRTGSAASQSAFDDAKGRIEYALDDLRRRAEDRPRQRVVLDTLGQLIGARIGEYTDAMALKKRQSVAKVEHVVHSDTLREVRGGMQPLLQRMREEELVVLAERTRLMASQGKLSRYVVLGGSIVAFLVAAVVLVPGKPAEVA